LRAATIWADVKLLLDTHVALWWQLDDRRLNRAARRAIATADVVWLSAVSGWEVAIKVAQGRLRLREPFRVLIAADDFTQLPITLEHADTLLELPPHHKDPFDRVLVAQAKVEGAMLVSHDRAFAPYGVPMIWT
jgi:PIN domain nuclease of toxin-antitoxin system